MNINRNIFIPILPVVKKTFVKNKQNYKNLFIQNRKKQCQIILKRQFHSFNPNPGPNMFALSICLIYLFHK